jgi:curli production assembly/transport component CsgE
MGTLPPLPGLIPRQDARRVRMSLANQGFRAVARALLCLTVTANRYEQKSIDGGGMSEYALNLLTFFLLLALAGIANAEVEAPEADQGPLQTEDSLRGLVVDRTVTFFGREFYSQFVDVWREQPAAAEIDLVIHERPDARFGSEISVEFDRRTEFRAFVSPARSHIRSLAESAAVGLAHKLAEVVQQRRVIDGPDLGKGDL